MAFRVEDLDDESRFRLLLTIPYNNLIEFVFEYLKKKSAVTMVYWFLCLLFLCFSINIRLNAAGHFPLIQIIIHSALGLILLPLLFIPVHEFLHVVPYYLSGARNIRMGMDIKQYLFYVTSHRYVASPVQFRIVAITPFVLISSGLIVLAFILPGLWKWSLSIFLFVHATMCAGDFALLNFYFTNKGKNIYTWDDADKKEAYFYEKLS